MAFVVVNDHWLDKRFESVIVCVVVVDNIHSVVVPVYFGSVPAELAVVVVDIPGLNYTMDGTGWHWLLKFE